MGCDTAIDYGGTAMYGALGKIGTLYTPKGDKVLLAASGNASILPVIFRNLKVPDGPSPQALREVGAWADSLTIAITDILADASPSLLTNADSGSAATIDGSLLMAWRQHMWWVYTHTACRPHGSVVAIGSGTEVALGSLHTSIALGAEPENAVRTAVQLACRHATGCGVDDRGPIIYSTKAD